MNLKKIRIVLFKMRSSQLQRSAIHELPSAGLAPSSSCLICTCWVLPSPSSQVAQLHAGGKLEWCAGVANADVFLMALLTVLQCRRCHSCCCLLLLSAVWFPSSLPPVDCCFIFLVCCCGCFSQSLLLRLLPYRLCWCHCGCCYCCHCHRRQLPVDCCFFLMDFWFAIAVAAPLPMLQLLLDFLVVLAACWCGVATTTAVAACCCCCNRYCCRLIVTLCCYFACYSRYCVAYIAASVVPPFLLAALWSFQCHCCSLQSPLVDCYFFFKIAMAVAALLLMLLRLLLLPPFATRCVSDMTAIANEKAGWLLLLFHQ